VAQLLAMTRLKSLLHLQGQGGPKLTWERDVGGLAALTSMLVTVTLMLMWMRMLGHADL